MKKQRKPCAGCGRGMAVHRGKRITCSGTCAQALRQSITKRKHRQPSPEHGGITKGNLQ